MTDEVIEVQQPEAQPTEQPQEPQGEQPEVKPPKTFTQEELDRQIEKRLARERKKFERESAELRQIALQREQHREQHREAPKQEAPGMPKIEDYQDFESYLNARDEFLAQRLKGETIAEYEKRQQAERAQAEREKTVAGWNKRVAAASADMPDFTDVVGTSDTPMTEAMAHVIMESEAGTKLAYYLATHPDEAEEIASMSPLATVRALTRIEDKLSNEKAQVSNAPPPTNPVGTKAKASKEPHEMDAEEFAKWRKAYIAKR